MYVRILPGRQALLREQFHWDNFEHPPYSPDLAPADFFLFLKMKEHFAGKRFANNEDLKDAAWITRRPHGMKRVYTNWCQGTTSALLSKATMWKSRQRYEPKLIYSVSVLLLKNILVWPNVLYFMGGLLIIPAWCRVLKSLAFNHSSAWDPSSCLGY